MQRNSRRKKGHGGNPSPIDPNSLPTGAGQKIHWIVSDAKDTYANAFNVSVAREEITLLFGADTRTGAKQTPPHIQLLTSVIVNPFTLKRLSRMLDNIIQQYESHFGPLALKRVSPVPPASAQEQRCSDADALFQLTRSLGVKLGYERSFKISEKTLLTNRFLLGTTLRELGPDAHERINNLARQMKIPSDFMGVLQEHLPETDYVHFGFEQNGSGCLYKLYLEFYDSIEEEVKHQQSEIPKEFLLHLGLKWNPSETSARALTRYVWHPWLSMEDILERVSHILDVSAHQQPFEAIRDILTLASKRMDVRDILYLDVTEQNSERKSFDINVYNAHLQLGELYPLLAKICERYSIPPDEFHRFYDGIKSKIFGHISGGNDREGKDFLTIYYGVEGIEGKKSVPFRSPNRTAYGIRTETGGNLPNSSGAGKEERDERTEQLIQVVHDLNIQYALERSFKFVENNLLSKRVLLGFQKHSLRDTAEEKLSRICKSLNMPAAFQDAFFEHLPRTRIVLFGLEGDFYKAYVEFGGAARADKHEGPGPLLTHIGFKWDAVDNSHRAVARYRSYPLQSLEKMIERISALFPNQRSQEKLEILKNVFGVAATRIDPGSVLYIEAEEDDNPRISSDVNVYSANLAMREIYPYLLDTTRLYSIPFETFQQVYKAIEDKKFGHLTTGTDRFGRDFLTFYFREKVHVP
jgi:hypothetical protein